MIRRLIGLLTMAITLTQAQTKFTEHTAHLQDFQVIEFRRYTIKAGEREHFARYFESYFPEAIQQVGGIAFGQFFERADPCRFTWIRGFHDMDGRASANGALYGGPLWKEHRDTMNQLMLDSDNVLLLRPLSPERGIPVLPTVDPVYEPKGAQGVIVAQIFAVKRNGIEAFARQAETAFNEYRSAGAREAGVLITLDVPNNFPKLPFRTDGSFLVWLGVLKDDKALETRFRALANRSAESLSAGGLLRGTTELVVMDPAHRSRLRWLSEWQQ
jgi:hypothetical protein